MGSLMSGWDSPTSSSRRDLEKSRSLTREEIENFWKTNKAQEDHMKAVAETISDFAKDETMGSTIESSSEQPWQVQASRSFVGRDKADLHFTKDVGTNTNMKPDWWSTSHWAFLNEPPLLEMEDPACKYAAKYHVVAHKPDVSGNGVATAF